jgi:flap endonuclease-1
MGIKHLNRFLREEAQDCIKFISLAELSGKKIAVDISIYMYKYASEGTLLENMYLMLSTMIHYNIVPVFIFDGKPPPEKKLLLQKRKEDKQEAEKEYNQLKKQLENKTIDDVEKQEVVNNMDILKKKFIHIGKNEIDSVKRLIRAYGATYYDAPGEADELCASLVIKNKVWACLSEDMDMFVYGCNRVLRYLSLLNKTVVLYDTKDILNSLGITQKELREICVISGTDYNYNENKTDDNSKKGSTLYKTLAYFKKYHKENSEMGFYKWLKENTDYIQDYENLLNIYNLFELNQEHTNLTIFENIKIVNGPIIKEDIRNIIKIEGFIFPES